MPQNYSGDEKMLQNLAEALCRHKPQDESKLPPVTDRDILRAMLGKPWPPRCAEPAKARKAG